MISDTIYVKEPSQLKIKHFRYELAGEMNGKTRHNKDRSIIGEHFLLPTEWLPNAKTVISFFLPFSEQVRRGNKNDKSWPSPEWLHARIEGQTILNNLSLYLKKKLFNKGFQTIVPILDEKFYAVTTPSHTKLSFTSNWSERHVAYICGLGTFSLSKGIITSKGMAGRFGSIITELSLIPSPRNYQSIDEYCSMCGKCAKNCPVNAISLEDGKDHLICSAFLNKTEEKFNPRYGCGKYQVNVPCETRIPKQI